ncbi:MAG: hypothetical protein AAF637_22025 [Pseudomonadota bacterium]
MRWLIYLGLGFLTYWLLWGAPVWGSLAFWLVVMFWPFVLIWQIGWWLLKVLLAVGLALLVLAMVHDAWQRRKSL